MGNETASDESQAQGAIDLGLTHVAKESCHIIGRIAPVSLQVSLEGLIGEESRRDCPCNCECLVPADDVRSSLAGIGWKSGHHR
jgi:hypothetical protein